MAQPASAIPLPLLIPTCRENGILLEVLDRLPLTDLITLYYLAPRWRRIFDDWDSVRVLMFRVPKRLEHANNASRVRWLEGLWQDMYKQMGETMFTPGQFWERIRVNPMLTQNNSSGTVYGWPEPKSGITKTYFMGGPITYATQFRRIRLPAGTKYEAKALVKSMFVSYPPVTRVEICTRIMKSGLCQPMVKYILSAERQRGSGFTVEGVRTIFKERNAERGRMNSMMLWPDLLYRLENGLPQGGEENGREGIQDSEDAEADEGSEHEDMEVESAGQDQEEESGSERSSDYNQGSGQDDEDSDLDDDEWGL